MLGADAEETIDVGRLSDLMDDEDRSRLRRDGGFDRVRLEVVSPRIDIGEDRRAPDWRIEFAVAMNDIEGQMTSSLGPTPETTSDRCSAAVQLQTATASAVPQKAATARSNSATLGPCVTQPLSTVALAARASAASK